MKSAVTEKLNKIYGIHPLGINYTLPIARLYLLRDTLTTECSKKKGGEKNLLRSRGSRSTNLPRVN